MPRADLVGQWLGEQLPQLARSLAAEALEVALDLQCVCQHRQGVSVHVEVVVGALFDPAQRLQLGQDDGGQPELVEQGHAAQRVGPADQLAQLDQLALPCRLGGAGSFAAGERDGGRVDLEAQVGREAGGAQ